MRAEQAPGTANTFAVAWILCIGLSGVSATLLHLAPDRASAAWIVVPAVVWCLVALVPSAMPTKNKLWLLFLASITVRAPLWASPLHLSDDAARYVWEGTLLLHQVDPWLFAPAQVHLPGWEAVRSAVNHPSVPSAYPPGAALWFALISPGGTLGAQIGASLADSAVVLALARCGSGRGALWYALHPLAALESASSGHLEAPALALAAWSWGSGRTGPTVALAAGSIKLLPLLTVPTLLRITGWKGFWTAGILMLCLVVLVGPWLTWGHLEGFSRYAQHWSFNGLIYPWLSNLVSGASARWILGAAGLVGVAAAATRRDAREAFFLVGLSFVAITPTMHPWYALWLLAPAAALERRFWMLAAAAPLLSYTVLWSWDSDGGTWREAWWLWWLTWTPAFLALGAGWLHSRRPSKPT